MRRTLLNSKLYNQDAPAGSAGLIGAPPSPPAAGNHPPADPGAGNPPAPSTQPAPPAAATWPEGLDPAHQSMIQAKGWKSPVDALTSYQHLEKMLGSEKIPVPKSADDKEAWNALYKAIGRPDAAAGYGLDKMEGIDAAAAAKFSEIAHANGLSVQAAQALAKFDIDRTSAAQAAQETAFQQAIAADAMKLKESWGQNYDNLHEAASRAARQFGFQAEELQALDRSIGHARVMGLLSEIGKGLLEARPVGMQPNNNNPGVMTKEGAAAEIARMKADPEISKRLYNGDTTLQKQFSDLQRVAYAQ